MSKSIAELRQSPRVGLPERSYSLCLASALVSEVQALLGELEDAQETEAARAEGDETAVKPKRMADAPRSRQIRERLSELHAEMADHTGSLTLRGVDEGKWRMWVDEHPARDGNERDDSFGYGIANIDALVDDLSTYAIAWNGDSMGPGDWEFIKANAVPGDLRKVAQLIVAMHESAVDVPKLLSSSLGIHGAASE